MAPPSRPVPDDFQAIRAELVTWKRIRAHYGIGDSLFRRWLEEIGHVTNPIKAAPTPPDLAEKAKTMHIAALEKHYGVSRTVVTRWLKREKIQAAAVKYSDVVARKAPPADFLRMAPTLTKNELRLHYRCGFETLDRWLRETGAKPMSYVEWRALNPVKCPVKPRIKAHSNAVSINLAAERIHTIHDIAADTLRRERFVVHRCNENGKYAQAGDFFRVGWSVLTPDELLTKAARYERKAA